MAWAWDSFTFYEWANSCDITGDNKVYCDSDATSEYRHLEEDLDKAEENTKDLDYDVQAGYGNHLVGAISVGYQSSALHIIYYIVLRF